MTTTTARPRWHLGMALKRLGDHRCACLGCEGSTTPCEWPTWRRCQECGCLWKPDTIAGRRYAFVVRAPRCRAAARLHLDPEEER